MKVQKARLLRQNQTAAEAILWEQLRNRRLANYKFRRQYPVEHYLEAAGYRLLRFWNDQVSDELPVVLETVRQALKAPRPQGISIYTSPPDY